MQTATDYATARIDEGLSRVPSHMRGAVKRYFLNGIPPGGFLTALLSNDLMGALGKADSENIDAIRQWGEFLYNYAPGGSHGSPAKVAAWLDAGGLLGQSAETAAA